jgi:tRNA modification GTPase
MTGARLLTPRGPAGIAVLELRGAGSAAQLAALGVARLPEVATVRLVRLAYAGRPLDEALLVRRDEDVFELHLHGSPPLVDELLALCGAEPPAPAGLEEVARARLADAPSALGARLLLDQTEGALRGALQALARRPDAARARELARLGRRARFLLAPARVVLAGPVNAGKSTLFNALVGARRVAVHARAGTTRDAIQARAMFGPWPVDLVDTAGARRVVGDDGPRRVERAGQRRARDLARAADLALLLYPADGPPPPPAARGARLATCADRSAAPVPGAISALTDPGHARRVVAERFARALDLDPLDVWVAGRAVPFEDEQIAVLEELAAEAPEARERLARLLAQR